MNPQTEEKQYQDVMNGMIGEDKGVAYNPARLVGVIQKDRIWITQKKAEEPLAKFDSLTGQIIAGKISRALYLIKDQKVPSCTSPDAGVHGSLNPEFSANIGIPDKQSCYTCPYNQWGTSVNQSGERTRGKACKERRNLLLRCPEFSDPLVISIAVMSLANWDAYCNNLALSRPPVHFSAVQTTIKVKTVGEGTNQYGVATFTAGDKLPVPEVLALPELRQTYTHLLGAFSLPETDLQKFEEAGNEPRVPEGPGEPPPDEPKTEDELPF